MQDHRYGDGDHGYRIYLHEECTDWTDLHCSGVGVPHIVFLFESEDGKAGKRRVRWIRLRRSGRRSSMSLRR